MADKVLKSLNIGDGNVYKPLPLVTSDDDGKILKVTGGEWGAGYVIEPEPEIALISFTIDGTSYQAEQGMTWNDWVRSEYNNSEFCILSSPDDGETMIARYPFEDGEYYVLNEDRDAWSGIPISNTIASNGGYYTDLRQPSAFYELVYSKS